ncbi:MAG: hypothetical protein KY445_16000 [Armatimonadetes bacterium]|nr:hypothetical protein [Armatimonadota bacterium]
MSSTQENEEKGALLPPINPEWLAEFEAAARRPIQQRWKYAVIKRISRF